MEVLQKYPKLQIKKDGSVKNLLNDFLNYHISVGRKNDKKIQKISLRV